MLWELPMLSLLAETLRIIELYPSKAQVERMLRRNISQASPISALGRINPPWLQPIRFNSCYFVKLMIVAISTQIFYHHLTLNSLHTLILQFQEFQELQLLSKTNYFSNVYFMVGSDLNLCLLIAFYEICLYAFQRCLILEIQHLSEIAVFSYKDALFSYQLPNFQSYIGLYQLSLDYCFTSKNLHLIFISQLI